MCRSYRALQFHVKFSYFEDKNCKRRQVIAAIMISNPRTYYLLYCVILAFSICAPQNCPGCIQSLAHCQPLQFNHTSDVRKRKMACNEKYSYACTFRKYIIETILLH